MKSYQELWQSLTPLYEASEAQAIVRLVLEVKYGMTLTDIIGGKVNELSADEGKKLEEIIERLQNAEPVQYVLGQADFMGMTFHVEPGVLIPRPETAELCQWIIDEENTTLERMKEFCQPPDSKTPISQLIKGMGLAGTKKKILFKEASAINKYLKTLDIEKLHHPFIMDLCTGSGCIAITLNKNIKNCDVLGIDISEKAIEIAKQNAKQLEAPSIGFSKDDILDFSKYLDTPYEEIEDELNRLKGSVNVIVSNPPYICEKEKAGMAKNVLEHEPSLALFVPDDDPLLFYRTIAKIGLFFLKPFATLYYEVNPLYADEIKKMLEEMGYLYVVIKEDSFGKKRMIRARRNIE